MPTALAGSVVGVLGLDTVRRTATPHLVVARHDAKNAGSRRDVVSGDNGLYGDGYNAAPGWDFVSGWGNADMLAFSRYLQSQ